MFVAKIYITLKPTVNDPEGITIKNALEMLGFKGLRDVRTGKYIRVFMDDHDENKVKEMCDKILRNPVIEEYSFEIEEVKNE